LPYDYTGRAQFYSPTLVRSLSQARLAACRCIANAASTGSQPPTSYTYDPFGNPTLNRTANNWPFLYKGIEKEITDPGTYYYTGGGQFYSPQLVRSLSETSQTSSQGTGSGPSGNAIAAPSGGGNGSFGSWLSQDEENNLKNYFSFGNLGVGVGDSESGFIVPVGTFAGIIEQWISFFEWLLGGGSPPIPRQLTHARHPLYPVILGVSDGLIPTEASEADSSVLAVQATRVNPGDDPDLGGLKGKELDAEIRRLSELARSKPNGRERQKLQRKINELRVRKSKKAHRADKFSWIPIVPEPPLAADSSDLPETLDILIEVLEFAL